MPRCKNCKKKFEAKHFNQKYCFNPACVQSWVESAKKQNSKKLHKKWKKDLETVQSLMKKAQKYFNSYIRSRDKNQDCISCGNKLGDLYDAGHYYSSGGHKSVTFDPDNCHAQCRRCNHFLSGNLLGYQEGIAKRIGPDRLFELHEKAHKIKKYTREELYNIIEEYKTKKKEL